MAKRKITGFLTCTSPMEFLKGGNNGLSFFDHKTGVEGWYILGEYTLDVDVDYDAMTKQVLDGLDELKKEVEAEHILKLKTIKDKRESFLALSYDVKEEQSTRE